MILVTGGTGLVGAHLLLHLIENGESVRAIYRNIDSIQKTKSLFSQYNKEPLFNKIEWMKGDIIDVPSLEIAFEKIEYVYHCAALISFEPNDEDLLRKINIEGTANIVNFCIAKNVQKLCFVSSIAALGDLKENEKIITEDTEWNPEKPHSDYAISKYGAEMEIWRGQQEGVNAVIVNPGMIIGPGFLDQGSGKLIKNVQNGMPFYTTGTTGYIAVTDVVKVMVGLINRETKNERYILISENIVYRDFFNSIAMAKKIKKPSIYLSPLMMKILWRMDWVISTLFRKRRFLVRASAKASYSKKLYSNEKIKNALNMEFLDIHQYIMANANL
ncbi:NAD-dependent epimerase/dehydratase family protein [Flavobacterium cellulosilyticum]|uniref:NAD-dependent epimerase/dehydratase family protein n=1 Tax=Flavobacterium cellulosilyticum TaxID=2541731 RepID=A0A4V2Z018_9FLAO|nr:NAD-dependent epimerase/dehydratase family protein [Flavobacterium cellulosilyticum]TDD99277.1 NAD-dependent epimerase/dehydratase family protein [Flavobacterium cellulosilyticum]